MARGLAIPVGVDATGGTAMAEGDPKNTQVISTAIADCDSDHAYQLDLGVGSGMIFDINDPEGQSQVIRRVRSVFQDFRDVQRFKLLPNTIKIEQETEGELVMEFKYIDLESDEEKTFRETLTGVENPAGG
jgi:hypothetical protein